MRRLFQVGASTLILVLGSRSKTHLLVLVHEERSHQNGGEALVLVEQGQGYLVRQELAAGRCPRALPNIRRELRSTFRIGALGAPHFHFLDGVELLSRPLRLPVGFTPPLLSTFSHSVALCPNVLAQCPVPRNC